MKTKKAIKAMMLAAALAIVGGGVAASANMIASADGEATENTPVFKVAAASIRTEDHETNGSGLRFAVVMDNATYESVAVEGVELGMLVLPTDMLGSDNALTFADVSDDGATKVVTGETIDDNGTKTISSKWVKSTVTGYAADEYMMSVVYIYGMDETLYNCPVTAVGYYDPSTAENDEVYSGSLSKSICDMAVEHGVTDYINNYDAKFFDADGTTVIDEQSIAYGSTAEAPDVGDITGYKLGWNMKLSDGSWSDAIITKLPKVTKNMHFRKALYSETLMKEDSNGNIVYDGPTGDYATNDSQYYYLSGSGKSVYLDTTITTDAVVDTGNNDGTQGLEGVIIKVGDVERRVLFANNGVYVFTEKDGDFVSGKEELSETYTNSGLTASDGTYTIYQTLGNFGKYWEAGAATSQPSGMITPYGVWYGTAKYTHWGDISACNNVIYVIDDGYLHIAMGATDSVSPFLKIDLNCMFNGLINEDTVYTIGYASSGARYYNNNSLRGDGIIHDPAYVYKTNSVLYGDAATTAISAYMSKYQFTDSYNAMMVNADGSITNNGTVDGSSNYYYLKGSGNSVYLNTDIVTDGYQTRSGGNTQSTEGIIIRVGETVRRVLFAGKGASGVYVFTEKDGEYDKNATGAAQYTNSGLTDTNGNYACYSSLANFGKFYDVAMNVETNNETDYGTWYDGTIASQYNGYGRLNNGTATGNVSTNVTYVIDGSYLYIALEDKAFLKLNLNCLFYGLINEDTVFEVGYASSGNKYGGSNTNQGAQTEVWYSYKTNTLLYGEDAATAIANATALFA